jgi:putative zinc finger protein
MVDEHDVYCEQVWLEISNYLEGDVDQALRAKMDEHFRACKHCASVLEGTRNVIALYSDEKMIDELAIEVPAGFGRRLERRLAQTARWSGTRWSSWSAWLVPVAALALIAGGLRLANSLTDNPPLKFSQAQPGHDIPPGMVVVVSTDTDSKLFHVAGCPFIHDKNKVRTLTAKQAIEQGYTPCLRCMRKYLDAASDHGAEPDGDNDADAEAEELSSGR